MIHRLPEHLLTDPVRVLVVGCGGSGSAIAGGLPYLHQAILARGHRFGLDVILQDGDTISETNCVRQPFSRSEIGHHKATVLATRMNLFWGLRWKARPWPLTPAEINGTVDRDPDIVIGCVDTAAARRVIADLCARSRATYWLDLGNNAESGQFILGQPLNAQNRASPERLPTVAELYPEILEDGKGPPPPSCSAIEALTRQAPFVNQVVANHALALLARLFAGSIEHQGEHINLATGQVRPEPIRLRPIERTGKGARARRRAKRQRKAVTA